MLDGSWLDRAGWDPREALTRDARMPGPRGGFLTTDTRLTGGVAGVFARAATSD